MSGMHTIPSLLSLPNHLFQCHHHSCLHFSHILNHLSSLWRKLGMVIFYEGVAQPSHNQHVPMQPFAYPQGPHQPAFSKTIRYDIETDISNVTNRLLLHPLLLLHPSLNQPLTSSMLSSISISFTFKEKLMKSNSNSIIRWRWSKLSRYIDARTLSRHINIRRLSKHGCIEQHHQNQVAQQEYLTQQHRAYEQQQHLEEMYEEHNQLSEEQHKKDEQRQQEHHHDPHLQSSKLDLAF
ncbi:hypothetical protein BS17DRAFT_766250 [Gyrodon lividus]|nr:hypothetical protein BS17DRAFT_766250 [Gyrodon lividus]